MVREVLLLKSGTCKGKSQWDTTVVECLDNGLDEALVAVTARWFFLRSIVQGERTIEWKHSQRSPHGSSRGGISAYAQNEIEAEVLAEIRQVKTCFHNRSLSVSESTAVFESFQQSETRLVAAFRLSHVVHICFKDIECTRGASLDFELFKAHGHILLPYIIGGDVCAGGHFISKIPRSENRGQSRKWSRVEFIHIEGETSRFFFICPL